MLSGFQRSNKWKMPALKNSDDHSSGTLSWCYCRASGDINILYGYNIERGSGKGADMKTLAALGFPLNSKHFKYRNIRRHECTVCIVYCTVNKAHWLLISSIKELLSDPDLIIAQQTNALVLPSPYICHWCLVNLHVVTPVIVYANSEQAGHVLVEVDVDVYAYVYDSLSDVPESWVCFASKNLTPCRMHWNDFLMGQIIAECHSFPNMYDML